MMTSKRMLALLLGLALLAMASRARADAGDGTQSVFAAGFGNRALAMGSAFVATADDPSALCWNPAGLARLRSPQLQLAQSNGPGARFHEGILALGVPDWRWGSGAVSVRTFGIDNLEQRDDRNRLVSSDLSDQEMEVALGYAKSFGSALALGASLKTQRQSLAGLDAMGFGVDAGMRVSPGRLMANAPGWLDDFAGALAVRNLVRPVLKLDREGLPDPTVFRAGFEWHGGFGSLGSGVMEVDLEHVSTGGDALHSGIELRPYPLMALRAGLSGGRLTAGTGLEWRRIGFDYAYLDNPVAAEHRLEVSYAFGRSVDASRAAAQAREERRLEARLDDGYRRRQDAQVTDLLARAETARAAGHYDEALEALASARILAPEGARVRELELRCLEQKAYALQASGDFTGAAVAYDMALAIAPADSEAMRGAGAARHASDVRAARSAAVRTAFARALDAFSDGRLIDCRRELVALLTAAPADSDAIRMLRRTDQAIARAVVKDLDRADDALRAGRTTDALAALDAAEELDPTAPGIASRRAECRRIERDASAAAPSIAARVTPRAPTAVTSRPHLSPDELERLYRSGVQAQAHGQVDESIRCWEGVQAASPGYRGVDALLIRQYLTRGLDAFAAGRPEDAIRDWECVVRIAPDDARAKGYLDRAREQITRRRQLLGEAH